MRIIKVQYRRKSEGKTDYYKRKTLLKSNKARLVVRKSLKYLGLHIVEFVPSGDKVVISFNSKQLGKQGWKHSCKNLPAAYLSGLMIGKLAQKKGIKEAILDMGMHPSVKGSKIYAAVKGAIDSGLMIPCGKDMLPDEKRLTGEHIKKDPQIKKELLSLKEKIMKGN